MTRERATRPGEGLSVLLIEDNPGDRRLTEIALGEASTDAAIGCVLRSATTLAEGLAALSDKALLVDVVLLDLGLPDTHHLDGLKALRRAHPEIPVVVLTGLSDIATATEALKFGASDYLDKAEMQPRPLLRALRYAIERKKSESELVRLATTDPLTGLLNRRAFFEQLDQAVASARRCELACALLMLDIDHFKEVNDIFGHQAGDELLKAIAATLRAELRETDVIARLGGDEFAVVATHLKAPGAAIEIAEKIAGAIKAIRVLDDARLRTSVSIGISLFPAEECGADTLLSHADMALYKSKSFRRGSITFFDSHMDTVIKASHALRRRMPADIAAGRFFLHFQPIIDARSGAVVAAEGLARWADGEGRLVPPGEFIPLAERFGLIGQLAAALLDHACASLRRWIDEGVAVVPISLNISPIQCRDPAFGLQLVQAIDKHAIPPSLINIEMTESTIVNNLEVTRRNLEHVKALGVGIHIDDFGTGYSSLSLLRDLPFDGLKIDRSFVSGLGTDGDSEAIIQAIVELARKLEFQTVAEGVETAGQAKLLASYGIDRLQGYHFARPLDAAPFVRCLGARPAPLVAYR